jgi:hypothetical protein
MKIDFVKEDGCVFALAQNAVYKGKHYDELMFAEIESDGTTIRWEDDYMNKIPASSLEEAKKYILSNLVHHKPHVNGAAYDIE